jgi:hypothetical protein
MNVRGEQFTCHISQPRARFVTPFRNRLRFRNALLPLQVWHFLLLSATAV